MSELHHECGIAAIYHLPGGDSSPLCPEIAHGVQAREEVSRLMPRMLLDIQNRGQLSAGFTTFNPRRNQLIDTYKEIGSVSEVFRIKRRTPDRPLPLLVASLDQAADLALDPPRLFFTLAEKFWPGPLTLIVPASRLVPFKVTANTGKVGLRWPRAPLAVAMIGAADRPLTGTSANVSDQPPCSTAAQVDGQLGRVLPLILDAGPTKGKLPSTLVDLTASGGRILRQGGVSEKDLKEFLEPS